MADEVFEGGTAESMFPEQNPDEMAFNDMQQATADPADDMFAMPTFDEASPYIHTALGIAGMIPGIGNVADVIDAAIYYAEDDPTGMGLALASAMPLAGMISGAGRMSKQLKGVKKANEAHTINRALNRIGVNTEKRGANSLMYAMNEAGLKLNDEGTAFVNMAGEVLNAKGIEDALVKEFGRSPFGTTAIREVEQALRLQPSAPKFKPMAGYKDKGMAEFQQELAEYNKDFKNQLLKRDAYKNEPGVTKGIMDRFSHADEIITKAQVAGINKEDAMNLAVFIEQDRIQSKNVLKALKDQGFDLDDLYGTGSTEQIMQMTTKGKNVLQDIMAKSLNVSPEKYAKLSPYARRELTEISREWAKYLTPGTAVTDDVGALVTRALRVGYPVYKGREGRDNDVTSPNQRYKE